MSLKPFFVYIVFCASLGIIHAQQEDLSLNGYWKFNTILGDGANSLDISPKSTDIILDDSDTTHIAFSGKWQRSSTPERGSKMWGDSYFKKWFYTKQDNGYFRFKTNHLKPGFYEHFIYFPWGHHSSTIVKVKHRQGMFSFPFSQRNRTNTWLSLGIFEVSPNSYVEFTSHTKGMVSADVVMLRPIAIADYTKAQEEREAIVQPNYDDSHWQMLKVPGHFGMINAYANYSGKAWYRRHFELPKAWQKGENSRIRIRFDGVYHVGRVFVNGTFVGKHQGGFTPFEFDITDLIYTNKPNSLAVEADNRYTVGATWNWGGIIRDVTLIKNSDARVKWQYIHAEPNLKKGTANYEIKVQIENNSSHEKSLELTASIRRQKTLDEVSKTIHIPANSVKEEIIKGKLRAKDVSLWHFDNPELYHLDTFIEEDGKVLHKKTSRFGIRKFEATASQMLLNGEPVRLAGFNRVSDHRYWGSSEPEKLLRYDVDMMKTAGANLMRIMHGTQNKKLLELCDEKGILIFEEANIRDLRDPQFTKADFGFAKQWIKEMITRDSNHPSIVGWSVGNELADHWDYVKSTYAYAKALDPNRMALHVSNRGYQKGENATNNPLNYGDMIFQNIYQKNPPAVMDTIRKRWPNKAVFISEFGYAPASRFTTSSLDNNFEGLADWYQHFRGQRTFITGASVWTYNDYRSGYTQTLPSENRAWGLVNAWRTKRRYFETHQNENSPAKEMYIDKVRGKQKANVTIEIRSPEDFPSYTLHNYSLRYTLKNQNGNVLYSASQKLPTLSPGSPPWKGIISWKKLAEVPFQLHAELVTPNGYTRRKKTLVFDTPDSPKIDQVKASNNALRVYFTRKFDSKEYFLNYTIEGQKKSSNKTIANYIDVKNIPANKKVLIELVACNAFGESKPSSTFLVNTQGDPLPPIIWDGFIEDNTLVVGYSGDWEDTEYTVQYGASKKIFTKKITSNTRGMMTLPLNGEQNVFFQVKRTVGKKESQWSNTVMATTGKFEEHE